ncbi:MAG: hypothetical protein IPM74_12575 [Crocinitomicaceae bacterium]|nr:hypothetical protein [Crocinitomicaceae bacterium]MBK8926710.1 hypothetical protein [Crocinitomicaceae bacterium]
METEKTGGFDDWVLGYYNELESLYLEKIEESDNKEYAQSFYRNLLFERNAKLPKDSFFFSALSKLFLHCYRLNKENAIIKTIDQLHLVRERAEMEITFLEELYQNKPEESSFLVEETIESEWYLLSLEIHEISDLLAYFLAVRLLLEAYPKNETAEPFSIDAPVIENKKIPGNRKLDYTTSFTEHHQILALHFLLKQIGITPRVNVNNSDVARFAHLLTKHPITHIDNSRKSQILKRILSEKSDKKHLADLQFIRPFFEKLQLNKAIEAIDQEIKDRKENS